MVVVSAAAAVVSAAAAAVEAVVVEAVVDGARISRSSTTSSCSGISTTVLDFIASATTGAIVPMSEYSRRKYKRLCRRP